MYKKVAKKKDNHFSEIDKSDKEGCIFVQKTPELKKSLGQAPAFRVLGIFNRYRHPCEILSQRASIAKSGLKRIYLSINHDIPRKLEGVWRFWVHRSTDKSQAQNRFQRLSRHQWPAIFTISLKIMCFSVDCCWFLVVNRLPGKDFWFFPTLRPAAVAFYDLLNPSWTRPCNRLQHVLHLMLL